LARPSEQFFEVITSILVKVARVVNKVLSQNVSAKSYVLKV
jgi:hypothetical protein